MSTTSFPIFDPKWFKYEYISQSYSPSILLGYKADLNLIKREDKMEIDAPYMVIHTLCGEPIFYYFGSIEDARTLRSFENITTLEGEAIVADDIKACRNCGVKISVSQIKVAEHENINNYSPFEVEPETNTTVEEPTVEEKIEIDKNPNPFWVNPNDPKRIHRDEPKKGE